MSTVHIRKQGAAKKRYTIKKLLQGATPKKLKALNKATEWAREGKAKGREIEVNIIDPASNYG